MKFDHYVLLAEISYYLFGKGGFSVTAQIIIRIITAIQMEADMDNGWDTSTWIKNNKGKPIWKLWNNPIAMDDINQEISVFTTSPTSFVENTNPLISPVSTHVVANSLLVLPPPPVRICKNSFGQQQHLVYSLLAHVLIWICRASILKIR